jgi:hexosaminidase
MVDHHSPEISMNPNDIDPSLLDEIKRALPFPLKKDLVLHFVYQESSPLILDKKGLSVEILYGKKVEAFRALSLLSEHQKEASFHLEEKPRFQKDGVMLDCSRNGVINLSMAEVFLKKMALMGLDHLLLYTEDTYPIEGYPYFGYGRGGFTKEELVTLVDQGEEYGIELVPCIQTLGHLSNFLRWEMNQDLRDGGDTLLVGDEKTYAFIESCIKSCRECFHSTSIHIGMDESYSLGLGRHKDKFGFQDQNQLFLEHLGKVDALCHKYGFTPLMWSDMFFSFALGPGAYDNEGDIPQKILDLCPKDVELVYWDYRTSKEASYERIIAQHQRFKNPLCFAGGSWKWVGFAPLLQLSLDNSRAALKAALAKGVEDVFVTGWGDGGNEASFKTMYLVMQLFAEASYEGLPEEDVLSKRLYFTTGETAERMLLLDRPNKPDPKFPFVYGNPAKYLFYQDVIGGLFDRHVKESYAEEYQKNALALHQAAKESKENGAMYENLALLCEVLTLKSVVGLHLREAYQKGDKKALKEIAEKTLPEILKRMERFQASMEKQWMAENKSWGYEVLDGRMGWTKERILTAIRRLESYLKGDLQEIPELAAPLLYVDARTYEWDRRDVCVNDFAFIASANPI